MRYPLILDKVVGRPWAIRGNVLNSMVQALYLAETGAAHGAPVSPKRASEGPRRMMLNRSGNGVVQANSRQPRCVAVVPIFGIVAKYLSGTDASCGGFDLQDAEATLREFAADDSVTEIVLWINSPGGTVTGVAEFSRLVAKVNQTKPVYSYTDSEMCSAAYWISASGSGVFCSSHACVGSIGTYMAWTDPSEWMAKEGLELILIKDGDFKACTLPGQLTPEARSLLQDEVTALTVDFRSWVTQCRLTASGALVGASTMQGQSFLGRDAVSAGLADELYDSLEDLLTDLLQP